jgi:DNA repair exonuclease SbcCD ATPase subunit
MRFESIEFKNIFAYGEEIHRIDYSNDGELVLLKGKSGAGKSAILSLPILVLYGKLAKATKAGIANRVNKHGWVRGTIIKGQHKYVIEREFSPNSLKIWKDDEEVDIFGASAGEDYITTEIVEIPITTFTNMITISMKKFKSFLSMSPTERKQVVDEVFDVRIINVIFDQIKKDSRELGNSINGEQTSLYSLNQTLMNANNEIVKIREKNATPDAKQKIDENNEKIKQLNLQMNQFNEASVQVQQKMTENNQSIADKNKGFTENNMIIKTINDKLNLYNQSKCPTCSTPFSGEIYDEIKKKLQEVLQQKIELKNKITEELKELNEKSKKIQEASQKVQNGIYQIRITINGLLADNRVIDEKMKASAEYQAVQNIIDKTEKQIEEVKQSIDEKTKELSYLQKLQSVYSIDGVTKMVINNYLPLLNQEISDNLIMLDFPYTLTFNDKFDPTIKDCGQNVPVETLSDGEETRVNLVILCSLYKLIKRKYNDVNLLTVDEVVSSIDTETSAYVISYLKNFA